VHRDIKPDNILLDLDNTIKICDFGVSKIIAEGQMIKDSCGTPAFIAPEILLNYSYDPFPTDIWSSGVVLYAMTTGFFPFRGVNETQLHENILTGIFPKPKDISNELNDLLSKILNINPKKRISLEEILLHPWFKTDINNKKQKKSFNNLNLFTKAEKIIYSKLKLDYRKINKNIQLENFTNKNINTYFEEANQNVQTISFVFTPYNTRRENDEDDDLFYEDVNIEDEIIKFMPKVQEISRLYEIHNNCDFDQGYIVARKQMWKKKLMGSIDKSYDKKKNKNKDLFDNKDKKNNSSNKKEISSLNSNFLKTNNSLNNDKYIIDEDAIKFVESFGYKKEFIIKSIELNELNHASATYYLKLSFKNG
jgi:serine/threonine protein kinase